MKIKVCVIGATGRMGSNIIKVLSADDTAMLSGAVEHAKSSKIGLDASELAACGKSGCIVTTDLKIAAKDADVLIDFSGAEGTMANIPIYKELKKAVVIGSTGLTDEQSAKIKELSKDMPVILSSNMSLGVNLMAKLVEIASKALTDDFDIEIFEAHHKHKKDAPSGTALLLAESAAKGREVALKDKAVYTRYGITGERNTGDIGFQVLRGGDIVGDHTVFYCGEGERLEITHRATDRIIFAKGAVRAAKWLGKKPKGLYSINDVLGL